MDAGTDNSHTRTGWDDDACLRCGSPLESVGIEDFRVGGTSGGWKLLFGEWAELGEGMLKLEVRACTTCRTVDLRVPPA
ncbi:MAG TPA: hypothetical protein VJ506_11705 [Candidatus Limnocylindrales bacterium]|nr:hypothetical protein [Candidatus Limnocylindrales bacterium]